jgi:hypothetical protein
VVTNAIQREITVVNVKLMPRTKHALLVESERIMPNGTVKVRKEGRNFPSTTMNKRELNMAEHLGIQLCAKRCVHNT